MCVLLCMRLLKIFISAPTIRFEWFSPYIIRLPFQSYWNNWIEMMNVMKCASGDGEQVYQLRALLVPASYDRQEKLLKIPRK